MTWTITPQQKYPTNDPDFSSVSLLLHGDGINGSTTIVDSSLLPKTVTAVGNAQISTAIVDPFGRADAGVIELGLNGYATAPAGSSFSFGTGDFTIETWVYRANGENNNIWGNGGAGPGSFGFYILNNKLRADFYFGAAFTGSSTLGFDEWYHIAFTRKGDTFRWFLNGTVDHQSTPGNQNNTSNLCELGRIWQGTENQLIYIDDFRITKGVARYTGNFTPPTAPFPDF
jgi:hypothetical protein